jgi:hypothetical protein
MSIKIPRQLQSARPSCGLESAQAPTLQPVHAGNGGAFFGTLNDVSTEFHQSIFMQNMAAWEAASSKLPILFAATSRTHLVSCLTCRIKEFGPYFASYWRTEHAWVGRQWNKDPMHGCQIRSKCLNLMPTWATRLLLAAGVISFPSGIVRFPSVCFFAH